MLNTPYTRLWSWAIFVCACGHFCFAFVLFSWQFLCVWPKGLSICLTLPSKGWASTGSSGRKSHCCWLSGPAFQRTSLPCECSGLLRIPMPRIAVQLLKAEAPWGWSPWEVSSSSPSPSCSLVSQGWFNLRSSCLCCSLITLNFLEGDNTLCREDSS